MNKGKFTDERFMRYLDRAGVTTGHEEDTVTYIPRANDRKIVAYRCSHSQCQAEYYGDQTCPVCGSPAGESFIHIVGM